MFCQLVTNSSLVSNFGKAKHWVCSFSLDLCLYLKLEICEKQSEISKKEERCHYYFHSQFGTRTSL
jgi:hypothetical protein